MSEEVQEPKTEEPQVTETALSQEDLKLEIAKLKTTNERILMESKERKEKYQELKSARDTEEKTKLEENENWKELLDKSTGEKGLLVEELKSMRVKTLKTALANEVQKHAKDAFNINDIVGNLDSSLIKIDEENFTFEGIADAVNSLRDKKYYLFDTGKKTSMVDGRPGMGKPKKKDLSEMSMEEKLNTLRGAMIEQG